MSLLRASKLTKAIIWQALAILAIAVVFQNCNPRSSFDSRKHSRTDDGQGFMGKIYAHRGTCDSDPNAIDSRIIVEFDVAYLVVQECKPIEPLALAASTYTVIGTSLNYRLIYNGLQHDFAGSFSTPLVGYVPTEIKGPSNDSTFNSRTIPEIWGYCDSRYGSVNVALEWQEFITPCTGNKFVLSNISHVGGTGNIALRAQQVLPDQSLSSQQINLYFNF